MKNKTFWINGKGDGIAWGWYKSAYKSFGYNNWIEAQEPTADVDSCIGMTLSGWKSMKCTEKNFFMCQFEVQMVSKGQNFQKMSMVRRRGV